MKGSSKVEVGKIKSILIIKMSSLGDVILASPTAKAIKEIEPKSFIGWLVEDRNYGVLRKNPFIDAIFIWDRTFKGFIKILTNIRRYKWDLCLDLQGLFKSAIFSALSGAKKRLALERVEPGSHIFYTDSLPNIHFLHAIENYLLCVYYTFFKYQNFDIEFLQKAINWLRKKTGNMKPTIYLDECDRAVAKEIFVDDSSLIALCPGTTWASKKWLPKRWARVGDKLTEMGYKVVFLGAKADIPTVKEIRGFMKMQAIDLTGKTSLREAAGIMERARLVIAVDSGAMHLATAVGTPLIALFGPTDPRMQGPYGTSHKVIYKSLNCSPCRRRNCKKIKCMESISEDEVLELVDEILQVKTN